MQRKYLVWRLTLVCVALGQAPETAAGMQVPAAAAAAQTQSPAMPAAPAQEPGDWVEWMQRGRFWLNARLRYEHVDQDGFSSTANAYTLRTALGFETAKWEGFSGTLEFEDVTPLFEENYNSTTNGKTQYPLVVDPSGAEINQGFLEYSGSPAWNVKFGRQRINLDNQRFVGAVSWRQNEQTFDALQVAALDLGGIEAKYIYVDNVNRVNGEDSAVGDLPSQTNLVHVACGIGPVGTLTAYAYLLESDPFPTTSTDTYGARLAGKHAPQGRLGFQWAAEFASQRDAGDNPNHVEQDYLLGELGASLKGFTLLLGNEILGGSGNAGDAFQTPLATLHAFNGWADKFLTTPDDGLNDAYVSLEAQLAKFRCQAVWHDFQADHGSDDYGTELDLSISYPLRKEATLGIKYADYDAEDFATDTLKFWIWLAITV